MSDPSLELNKGAVPGTGFEDGSSLQMAPSWDPAGLPAGQNDFDDEVVDMFAGLLVHAPPRQTRRARS